MENRSMGVDQCNDNVAFQKFNGEYDKIKGATSQRRLALPVPV